MRQNFSEFSIYLMSSQFLVVFLLISLLIIDPTGAQKSLALSQVKEHKANLAQKEGDSSEAEETQSSNQLVETLNTSLRLYKEQPNPETWAAAWQNFKSLVWHFIVKGSNSQVIAKSVPSLTEAGVKLTAGNNVKIWSFPGLADCQQILVEWKETNYSKRPVKSGRRSHTRVINVLTPKVVTRMQAAPCPAYTEIEDGQIIVAANQSDRSGKSLKSDYGTFLVLTGLSRKTGLMWLAGYRLSDGNWLPNSDIFSQIPPYLAQNLQGKAVFSGTNLVLTVEEAKTSVSNSQTGEKSAQSQSGGYKITFRLVDMHYVLNNRLSADLADDPAASIAVQFAQAVLKGRLDLVKAWLIDAQLASIPGYLGLYSRAPSASPFKLVRMATQGCGATRFRLITFNKDDLILDIGKIKNQWLIKGLFIAPADPLAKTLAGIVATE